MSITGSYPDQAIGCGGGGNALYKHGFGTDSMLCGEQWANKVCAGAEQFAQMLAWRQASRSLEFT